MKKKICVDMSCSIIHNGHIRLLKKASKFGSVVIALTSDEDLSLIHISEPTRPY